MPEAGGRVGVLVMAYGTPSGPDDVERYYTHIRRGRPPTAELLEDLRTRYAAIGGHSPLLDITRRQMAGIAAALEAAAPGRFIVALGQKHAAPFIEDGVETLCAAGARRIVGLVLAPHFATVSIAEYAERAHAAAAGRVPVSVVRSWHVAPGFLDLVAEDLRAQVAGLGGADACHVIFTAHSLPARILELDDPYTTQLAETAQALAERAGVDRWSIAWQSAGRTGEAWIGPDLLEVMGRLAGHGTTAMVVCACGFIADHLEVLYDLDIEAQARADELGVAFARTRSPNADERLTSTLAAIVMAQAAQPADGVGR